MYLCVCALNADMCECLRSACNPSTLGSSFYNSGLWGFGSHEWALAENRRGLPSPDYTVTDPSGQQASREHAGCRDQSSAQTSCANMRLADHTMPVKGRHGVQQPHTEQPSCFILRCCVLSELHIRREGKEFPAKRTLPRGICCMVHEVTAILLLCCV